ncbi:MAG: transporter [Deltaproteobacteria bacterium]|nr:transporter [Deltaproteobacteria bacterium]
MKLKLLIGLFVFGFASAAFAQETGVFGFDAFTIKPSMDGSGTPFVTGSQILPVNKPYAGLVSGYHYQSVSNTLNGNRNWIVNHTVMMDLVASVGLFECLSVGFDLPFNIYEHVHHFSTGVSDVVSGVGDMTLYAKWRILKEGTLLPGLAVLPAVILPTGDETEFTGNASTRYEATAVADKDFELFYLTANATYRWMHRRTVLSQNLDDQLLFSVGADVPLTFWQDKLSAFAEGHGSTIVTNFSTNTTALEALAGLRKELNSGLRLFAAGSYGLRKSLGTAKYRGFVGLDYTFDKLINKKR